MAAPTQQLIAMALEEATRMEAALGSKADPEQVVMSAGKFATLSGLIRALAQRLTEPDRHAFGDPRLWVPLAVYEKNRRALNSLQEECLDLRVRAAAAEGSFAFNG